MGKIAGALAATEDEQTPLQRKLDELGKLLSKMVLGICVFIFAFNLFMAWGELSVPGHTLTVILETFMVAVSLAVAAIPEGLAAVVTVVLSIGVKPATAFLAGSGIELGKRGEIIVDEYMHTNVDGIWAVGDAIAVKHFVSGEQTIIPLASPANKQARIVADNIKGRKVKYNGTQGTSIAKVFDMTVASTGLTEKDCIRLGIDYHKSFSATNSHAGYYPGPTMMTVKLLYTKGEGKVLGGQIVGYKGVDKRIVK